MFSAALKNIFEFVSYKETAGTVAFLFLLSFFLPFPFFVPTFPAFSFNILISLSLVILDTENFQALRDSWTLTRDSRMKERKKCVLHGARKGTQFSKR